MPYNLKPPRWIHITKDKVLVIPARGSSLGANELVEVSVVEATLDIGDILFCFSDGCLEGPRPLRKLVQTLEKMERSSINFEVLFHLVNEIGKDHVLVDDKAMMMLTRV